MSFIIVLLVNSRLSEASVELLRVCVSASLDSLFVDNSYKSDIAAIEIQWSSLKQQKCSIICLGKIIRTRFPSINTLHGDMFRLHSTYWSHSEFVTTGKIHSRTEVIKGQTNYNLFNIWLFYYYYFLAYGQLSLAHCKGWTTWQQHFYFFVCLFFTAAPNKIPLIINSRWWSFWFTNSRIKKASKQWLWCSLTEQCLSLSLTRCVFRGVPATSFRSSGSLCAEVPGDTFSRAQMKESSPEGHEASLWFVCLD